MKQTTRAPVIHPDFPPSEGRTEGGLRCSSSASRASRRTSPLIPSFEQEGRPERRCALGAVALLLLLAPTLAEPTDNVFETVTTEVTTPHFAWAQPWAGGPLKVLVIGPAWGLRDAAELAERFELELDVAMTRTHAVLSGGTTTMAPDKVADRFDQALAKPHDVIVLAGFDWSKLLLEHRAAILKQVHQGTGFVMIGLPPSDELSQMTAQAPGGPGAELAGGVPWQLLTALQGLQPAKHVFTGTFGEGRWVRLDYKSNSTTQSLTPRAVPGPPAWEYEHYQSLLGKALSWAGRRWFRTTVSCPIAIDRSRLPSQLQLTVTDPPECPVKTLGLALHRQVDNQVLSLGSVPAAPVVDVPLPVVQAGDYLLCVGLLDAAGGTLDWHALPLAITADVALAELSVLPPRVGPGEPIQGHAKLSRPLLAGEEARVELFDNHGRLLRRGARVDGSLVDFSLDGIEPLGTSYHRLVGTVTDARGVVTQRARVVPIRRRDRPAFHFAAWEEPETDHLGGLSFQALRRLGVDAVFYRADRGHRAAAAELLAKADLWGAPSYPSHHGKTQPGPLGPEHDHSLVDPAYLAETKEKALASAGPFAPWGILFHPSGSDVRMGGQDFRPETLAAFRQWLRPRYDSLKALNQAWGTSFVSRDAIVPDTLDQAKQTGRQASWIEHVRFMEHAFAEFQRQVKADLAEVDPDPLMGEDGYGRLDAYDGADWMQLLGIFGFYNLYTYQDPPQLEITRSLAPEFPNVKLRSLYYGSYDGQYGNETFLKLLPWQAAFHGYNGLFWWVANGKSTYPGSEAVMLGPDFRPTRSFLWSKQGIDELRGGIINLLAESRRAHDGVAIYYDQTAVHAVAGLKHPSELVWQLQGLQAALEDLGLQYDYVAGPQVEAGRLTEGGYRVLVLPNALALRPETVEAIRQFVAAGGKLLADPLPGEYDPLLHKLAASPLADLFGGDKPGALAPLDWQSYQRLRYGRMGAALRESLAHLLAPAGLTPAVSFTVEAEAHGVPGVELVRYVDGPATYLALLNSGPARSGQVRLAAPATVYDLRAAQGLGQQAQWDVELESAGVKVYALLPGRVSGLEARATSAAARGEVATLELTAEGPAFRHAFRLEVADATGRARPEYAQVVCDGQARIPLALNDPVGTWQVEVTDVATGQQVAAALAVE